jgi:hypothetical protein
MRKHVLMILALGALIAVSAVGIATAAGGETPVTVQVGNLVLKTNGGFSPKALSKTKQTPISLTASGEISEADGSHPPAVREVIIEADKAGEVHLKGIPVCKSGQLQATETSAALKACGSSLIGEGEAIAQASFAEQAPINVKSKVLVFSGGESGGKATMFIHAFFTNPLPGALVTTGTITKHKNGRFGTLGVFKIPQITGGAGSIIKFNLEIFKSVKVGGKTYNPISSKCEDGKLKVHVEGIFEDKTKAETEIVRACTPKA